MSLSSSVLVGTNPHSDSTLSTLHSLIDKARSENNLDEAIRLLTDAISSSPDEISNYHARAECFLAKRQYVFALRDSNKAIELNKSNVYSYYLRGQCYESLLQYPLAIAAYETGLQVAGGDANISDVSSSSSTTTTNNNSSPSTVVDKITSALQELHALDATIGFSNPNNIDHNDNYMLLLKWLRTYGGKFPKLHLKQYTETHRGVHALGVIHNEEVVLYIPHRLIMTSEIARASPIGLQITRSGIELRSKHTFLAMYLLEERSKGDQSFWAPYIRTLPQEFSNMPPLFKEEHLELLQGSFTLGKIADRIESLYTDYISLCHTIPELRKYTYDDFVWARFVVITRIFGLVIGSVKTDGLVPLADMLNHQFQRDTRWCYDDSTNGFVITALTEISRGLEVYDSYGRKCNNRFFVNYGFVLDNNPDNEAVLRLQLKPDDLYSIKLRCLNGTSDVSSMREYQVSSDYHDSKCREVLSFARFIALTGQEVSMLSLDTNGLQKISISNETEALQIIRAAAVESLQAFPTTIAQDQEILQSEKYPMYSNERNCVVMRLGEKLVLQKFIELTDLGIHLLSTNAEQVTQWIQENPLHPHHLYVSTVVLPLLRK